MSRFILFPKLPFEVQQAVWAFACELEGSRNSRIQRIAKDPIGKRKTLSEPVELRIVDHPRSQVPSLLHVCKESRTWALKHWTRWPVASRYNFHNDGTYVYVNKAHDTFYFADGIHTDFWFLNCLCGPHPPELEDGEDDEAREMFYRQMKGIRHFAVDWWCWLAATALSDAVWMTMLCIDQQELTVVIKNPHHPEGLPSVPEDFIPTLREVTPGTVRAKSVDVVQRCILYVSEEEELPGDTETTKRGTGRMENSHYFVPNLRALAIVEPDDDENSEEDVTYLEAVRKQYRLLRFNNEIRSWSYERSMLQRDMAIADVAFPDQSLHGF